VATNLVFGATSEGRISLRVEEDFVNVVQQLRAEDGWVVLTAKGKAVAVNARNVLWVQEHQSSSRAAGFA
jgi:hypothetical protein